MSDLSFIGATTPDEVRERWLASEINTRFFKARSCSICNSPVGYVLDKQFELPGFDPTCDCTRYGGGPEDRSWIDFADFLQRAGLLEEQNAQG